MKHLVDQFFDARFTVYHTEIEFRNFQRLHLFSLVGLAYSVIDALAELLVFRGSRFPVYPICAAVYFVLLLAAYRLSDSSQIKHASALCYLAEAPIMVTAIVAGTFLSPEVPSISVLVLLCVLPLFFVDQPWRVALYILSMAVLFAVCSFCAKAHDLFLQDMANLVTFLLLALGINIYTLFERIESVEAVVNFRSQAERDRLTGVYNRGGDERIKELLRKKVRGAFLIADIDNFKRINDTYGHVTGDNALVCLTDTIIKNFRASDVVLRLGGDEFIVYAAGMTELNTCKKKLAALMQDIQQITLAGTRDLALTISIGCIIVDTESPPSYEELYRLADACLYSSKSSGRNQFTIQLLTKENEHGN